MNNKEKNQLGAIIFFCIGCIFFGYLLFDKSPNSTKSADIIKQNMIIINRLQKDNIQSKDGRFAKTFDELATGAIVGGDTSISKKIQYKINVKSNDLAIAEAKSLDKDEHSLVGVVAKHKKLKGLFVYSSILCKSDALGVDGTDPVNAPIIYGSGKLLCAPGWTIVNETQLK